MTKSITQLARESAASGRASEASFLTLITALRQEAQEAGDVSLAELCTRGIATQIPRQTMNFEEKDQVVDDLIDVLIAADPDLPIAYWTKTFSRWTIHGQIEGQTYFVDVFGDFCFFDDEEV